MDFSYKFHLTNVDLSRRIRQLAEKTDLSRRNEVKTDTLANVN